MEVFHGLMWQSPTTKTPQPRFTQMQKFWRRGKFKDLKTIVPYGKTRIQRLVREGVWREGLHFVTDDAGDRLYNLDLLADWIANLSDSVAHERACEMYLASLPSNQPQTRKLSRRKGLAA
jgi:hypothetical protein